MARALDVPLYRKTISGTAVEMGNEYGSRDGSSTTASGVNGDETEDLYTLLQTVKVRPLPVLDTRALNLPSFITLTSRVSLSVLFCLRTNASASSMCASTHSRNTTESEDRTVAGDWVSQLCVTFGTVTSASCWKRWSATTYMQFSSKWRESD